MLSNYDKYGRPKTRSYRWEGSAETLITGLIEDLNGRDWEEPSPQKYTNYRRKLIQEIVHRGDKSIASLLQYLEHPDFAVRGCVALMLGELRATEAVQSLKELLIKEQEVSVQSDILVALERIGTCMALDVFREWSHRLNFTPRQLFAAKTHEYLLHGMTDPAVMMRCSELAVRKGVTVDDIVRAYTRWELLQWGQTQNTPESRLPRFTTPDLSPTEIDYLIYGDEKPIQLSNCSEF